MHATYQANLILDFIVKAEFTPELAIKAQRGSRGIALLLL
jgi:hypothetical protein